MDNNIHLHYLHYADETVQVKQVIIKSATPILISKLKIKKMKHEINSSLKIIKPRQTNYIVFMQE